MRGGIFEGPGSKCGHLEILRRVASRLGNLIGGCMPTGFILAHKHTLGECYGGFFRALATESFNAVRHWLHPELEQLIQQQCHRKGEAAFLRSLRLGLGSASKRLRLGTSQPEGARQIRAQLLTPSGDQAGSVRFVLMRDGWRIYALEVWNEARNPNPAASAEVESGSASPSLAEQLRAGTRVSQPRPQTGRSSPKPGVPRVLSNRWFAKAYACD